MTPLPLSHIALCQQRDLRIPVDAETMRTKEKSRFRGFLLEPPGSDDGYAALRSGWAASSTSLRLLRAKWLDRSRFSVSMPSPLPISFISP